MKRHQMNMRRRITFDEWKERKDREMKKEKEMKLLPEMDGSGERMAEKRVIMSTNDIVKKVTDAIRDMQKNKEPMMSKLNAFKRQPSKADDYIVKEPGKLTFREWLHNKTIMQKEKMRREYEERMERERMKKEREEVVNKAYNVWLIRNKYRSLRNYYPHLGEEKIREILMEDLSRLPLISTKDVGVGDDTIDRMLGTMKS